jgi:hypothetical protein
MYFSITTMTSTGYGDIFPIGWLARLLVNLQMIIATFFQAVVVTKGVAIMQINRGQQRPTASKMPNFFGRLRQILFQEHTFASIRKSAREGQTPANGSEMIECGGE